MGLRGLSVPRRSNRDFALLRLTVSKILEIGELITPLSDDSESIFEECDHDEESAYSWKIANSSNPSQRGISGKWFLSKRIDSRLQRLTHAGQPIFNLASLFSNLI